MQRIVLSDEDAKHIKDWQRLAPEEKEALNKLAESFSDPLKRRSLYTLVEEQIAISKMVSTANHLGWIGTMFLRAGVIAGIVISVAGAWKLFFGGK